MSKEYLRPGVFVEEVADGAYPIEGVGTSTAGFVGIATRGALSSAKLITNWTQFVRHFGSFRRDSFLAYAVQGFFLNKGSRCYVVRVASSAAAIAEVTLQDRATTPVNTLKVQALNEGVWGNGITIDIADGTKDSANEFKITVKEGGTKVEEFDDLSMDDTKENFVENVINGRSNCIQVVDLDSASTPPTDRPATQTGTALTGGADGISDIADADFVGSSSSKTGLYAFDEVDDVNSIAVPGRTSQTVVQGGLDYCGGRADCGYIADCPQGNTPSQAKTFREQFDSSYGYCYYPWLQVSDPLTRTLKYVPPSGHVAGVFARSDSERGVHKAPANELVLGVVGLEYKVTDGEQEVLNPAGVNCIRSFTGRGIRIWGARTMSSDPNLNLIHKRRFLMFLEESISEGTQWAPFEPNDEVLWGKIIRSVSAFLRRQFLEGALFGESEEEAYYVRCDEELNPPEVRDAHQVVTEVGVSIVDTAEFVIFRIRQWQGGGEVSE
jgi:phage tail sheath protein FI